MRLRYISFLLFVNTDSGSSSTRFRMPSWSFFLDDEDVEGRIVCFSCKEVLKPLLVIGWLVRECLVQD